MAKVRVTQNDIAQGPDHLRQVLLAGGVTPKAESGPVVLKRSMRSLVQPDGSYLIGQEDVV